MNRCLSVPPYKGCNLLAMINYTLFFLQKEKRFMTIVYPQSMTVEEYFQLEENDPDTRYEYIDGHVYAMAGGTANHDTIKSNMQRILWSL
jgi:Uma2 family endonuclease